MSHYWSPRIRTLTPYTAGEQLDLPDLVKLNTNENPYGPAPEVLAAIRAAADDALRLYPDPDACRLKHALARHHGLQPQQVFVGNGSDEVLGLAFMAFFLREEPVLFPDVSYSFYPVYCALFGVPCEPQPVNERFQVDLSRYDRPCAGVVLPNPNAPTGIALPLTDIERLLALQPHRVVIVDEAYVDFGAASAVGLIDRHPNLLVVQTLSKSRGLAGLRVGYALGAAELIAGLERVKNSFNSYPLDRLALAAAEAAIGADAHFRQTCARVMRNRDGLSAALQSLGFEVLPSSANFVFASHPGHDAAGLARQLRERAILVRHFSQPKIARFLRISVGTETQCDQLVQALAELLASS